MSKLVKLGTEETILEGVAAYKECHDQRIMVTRQDGQIRCFVLPDAHNADSSRELPADKHQLQIYKDKDGTVWTTLLTSPRPVKDYTASPYKMDDTLVPTVPAPPPLVPFTGVDRKPMSPSPAKPFGMQASPLKPSPFKERVDTATQAVVQKSLVRKGALFGAAKQPAAEGAAAMPPVPPPAPPAAAATAAAAAAGPAIPVPPRPVPQQAAAVLAAGGMRIPGPDEMDS